MSYSTEQVLSGRNISVVDIGQPPPEQGGAPDAGFMEAMLTTAGVSGMVNGSDEIMNATLYEIGSKGTEANISHINNLLSHNMMLNVGMGMQGAFASWQGQDGSQLKAMATDGLQKVATKYNSFINNVANMNSDNPDVRKAAHAGLNSYVGEYQRMQNVFNAAGVSLSLAQADAAKLQGMIYKMQMLTPKLGGGGGLEGITLPDIVALLKVVGDDSFKEYFKDPKDKKNTDGKKGQQDFIQSVLQTAGSLVGPASGGLSLRTITTQ